MVSNINVIIGLLFIWFSQSMSLSPQERKQFLDIHNHLRRSVFPPAANMQELTYDEKIEKDVNEYLEECKFEHRRLDGYGENGRLATDGNITDTVMSWFQERVYFDINAKDDKRCSKENSKYNFLNEIQCGHYKMMVRGTLKSLGCGYKFCKSITGNGQTFTDSYISFCFYNAGQMDQPYEVGPSCTSCDSSYQFCNNDLCVPKSRYDKNSRSCKLNCQNCAEYFDPKNSCLCDCPEETVGSTCQGKPSYEDNTCTICKGKGLSCNGGTEISKDGQCVCQCKDEYQGEHCEIRKDQFVASYQHIINGIPWRYNMMVPVSIVEFQKALPSIKSAIINHIIELCLEDETYKTDCMDIIKYHLNEKDVNLIPNSLSILANGSLTFRMFVEYKQTNEEKIIEKFVPPSILQKIWLNQSTQLSKLIYDEKTLNQNGADLNIQMAPPALFDDIPQSIENNFPLINNDPQHTFTRISSTEAINYSITSQLVSISTTKVGNLSTMMGRSLLILTIFFSYFVR